MRLEKLELSNFQGLSGFVFSPNGENATIYGTNGTGKTTVYNALTWLLYEKPGTEEKGYSPKPILPENGARPGELREKPAASSVFARFSDENGRVFTLSKSFSEEWTKKRGSGSESFSGHRTECAVDGVPISKNAYEGFISKYFPDEFALILTRPEYFSAILPWQRRREILLNLCGDVKDDEVFERMAELAPLKEELLKGAHEGVKEFKTFAAKRLKQINERINLLPSLRDEAQRAIPPGDELEPDALEDELSRKLALAASLREELKICRRVDGVEAEFYRAQEEAKAYKEQQQNILREFDGKLHHLKSELEETETKLSKQAKEEAKRQSELESEQSLTDALSAKIKEHAEQKLSLMGACPSCGGKITAEKEAELTLAFENEKAGVLKSLQKELSSSLENIRALKAETEKERKISAALQESAKEKQGLIKESEQRIIEEEIKMQTKLRELTDRAETLAQMLADKTKERAPEIKEITSALEDAQNGICRLTETISEARVAKAQRERVKELEGEFSRLNLEGAKYTDLIYLCEVFIRAKVRFLTERINEHFPGIRFLLFEDQINGGLRECCEVLIPSNEGAMVPYAMANSGARIAAGLQIIDRLSKHIGHSLPVFVDNAESFVSLPQIDAQVIGLKVSPEDRVLRAEVTKGGQERKGGA